jgi:hypothetical protein
MTSECLPRTRGQRSRREPPLADSLMNANGHRFVSTVAASSYLARPQEAFRGTLTETPQKDLRACAPSCARSTLVRAARRTEICVCPELGKQIGEVIFEDDHAARIYDANVFGRVRSIFFLGLSHQSRSADGLILTSASPATHWSDPD